jgi:hypothetical protein
VHAFFSDSARLDDGVKIKDHSLAILNPRKIESSPRHAPRHCALRRFAPVHRSVAHRAARMIPSGAILTKAHRRR